MLQLQRSFGLLKTLLYLLVSQSFLRPRQEILKPRTEFGFAFVDDLQADALGQSDQ